MELDDVVNAIEKGAKRIIAGDYKGKYAVVAYRITDNLIRIDLKEDKK